MCGIGGGGGDGGAAAQRAAEDARNQRIQQGMGNIDQAFQGFNDGYYNDYAKKLVDYWTPDINQQYDDASKQLAYAFGSSNPGGSSASADAYARLAKERDRQLTAAQDNATSQSNTLRTNVANQRASLVNQLNSTADPSAAAAGAAEQAKTLSAPPSYSPLGDLFSNLTNQFAIGQQAARSNYPGWGFTIGNGATSATGNKGLPVIS